MPRDSKSHRHGKRPSQTAVPVPDRMPPNFSFVWAIDPVEVKFKDKPEPRWIIPSGKGVENDNAKYWHPPNKKRQCHRDKESSSGIWRWVCGNSEPYTDDVEDLNDRVYSETSVFMQAFQDNFFAVSKNCTRVDIINRDKKEDADGWNQIKFDHTENNLSKVGFMGRDRLTATPCGLSSWMPQVLPSVYDHTRGGVRQAEGHGYDRSRPGGLCGSLGIILAMAAFSAPVDYAEEAIAKCFKLGNWRPHNNFLNGIGRYHERGVVVTIWLDPHPDAEDITEAHIRCFEMGVWGAILAATPEFGPIRLDGTLPQKPASTGLPYNIPRQPTVYAASGTLANSSSAAAYSISPTAYTHTPSSAANPFLAYYPNAGPSGVPRVQRPASDYDDDDEDEDEDEEMYHEDDIYDNDERVVEEPVRRRHR